MSENQSALAGRKGLENNLFEKLMQTGYTTGTPENEELKKLAHEYLLGEALTYGTASFYDFLKKTNRNIKAYICNGSACLVAGTQEKVQEKLGNYFAPNELGHMCCLGKCYETSAFNYNGTNYSGNAIDDIDAIINGTSTYIPKVIHVESTTETVLTGEPLTTQEFGEELEYLFRKGNQSALAEIKSSKIRGRGGAGFPMGVKWEACKNEIDEEKFIVCNADEGDPGAYTDRYLLEIQPHRVLFGMLVAGFITGANWGALYIRAEYPEAVQTVSQAVKDLESAGLVGENILDSGFTFRFKVIKGAGAYICGEETALLSSLEGQRPEVRIRPPFPTQKGLFNKPTIVNNVETLAAVPWILKNGGENYAAFGTEKSSGTKLVSVDSWFKRPGVYEVEMGSSFNDLVYETAGGFWGNPKAVHVGGPLGGLVPIHKIPELTVDFESFSNAGFLLGHAGTVTVPEDFPMIKYIEHLFEFTAAESCGKCFPCSIGSVRGKEMFEFAQNGGPKLNRELVDNLLETMEIGSLCALGGGLPLGVKNALEYFEDELSEFFETQN
ncbi:MAG: NADH-ubiquinone oxidoreductase-F iron-sulfur binding region domain-containing protein [Pyrinomonadaceae bacterium]